MKSYLSRTIRTRNGSYTLPSKTLHIGIKASQIGGCNVWEHTKGKLERLSETAAQNNPENQAIDRVQKRILRHAPKTLHYGGRAAAGTLRVAGKVLRKTRQNGAFKSSGNKTDSAAKTKNAQSIVQRAVRQPSQKNQQQQRIRVRAKQLLKQSIHKVSIRTKKSLLNQGRQVIRSKQEQTAKSSAENHASATVERTAINVAPKVAKGSAKVVAVTFQKGKKLIWTIKRKIENTKGAEKKAERLQSRQRFRSQTIAKHRKNVLQNRQITIRTAKSNAKAFRQSETVSILSRSEAQKRSTIQHTDAPQIKQNDIQRIRQTDAHRIKQKSLGIQKNETENRTANAVDGTKARPATKQGSYTRSQQNIRKRNAAGELHTRSKTADQRRFRFRYDHADKQVQASTKHHAIKSNTRQSAITKRSKMAAIRKAKGEAKKQASTRALQQAKAIAIRAMRRSAKMVEQAVKAVATAIKALIAGVGGGALFVGLVVLIAGAAFIFASPFGIFFGSEKPETHHIPAIVAEINAELMSNVKAEQTSPDDEVDMEGDSPVSNWIDVLAVWAVKTTTDMNNPLDVGAMDDEKKESLKQVFKDMNQITSATETVTETDENGNQTTKSVKKTRVVGKRWQEMIAIYSFNAEQEKLLTEIMQGEYYETFILLLGLTPAQASPLSPEDWAAIAQDLPAGAKTSEIVKMALSKLGTTYDNDLRMSEGYYDCSSLTYRIYQSFGLTIQTDGMNTAAAQGEWCVNNNVVISYNDLQPGDLVFFSSKPSKRFMSIDHVGIYAGNGKIVDASSSRGCVVYRDIWTSTLVLCGRPSLKLS